MASGSGAVFDVGASFATVGSVVAPRASDTLECGEGNDLALVRPGDTTVNCERVRIATATDAEES